MDFQPVHPGLLKGSYTPRNSSSSQEVVANLQGVGVGPQPLYLPGTASLLFTAAKSAVSPTTAVPLSGPIGIAVDTFGDVFVADPGNSRIVAYCLSSTNTATTNSFCNVSPYSSATYALATGFKTPAGIALDDANNLYVTDTATDEITVIQSDNLASSTPIINTTTFGGTALNGPTGITVDGHADIYIADTKNNRIVEAHQYGAANVDTAVSVPSTTTFDGTALNDPTGLAVDANGDLFIADTGNNRIVECSSAGTASVMSTGSITLHTPTGVVVTPAGALLVSDTTNGVSLISSSTETALSFSSLTTSTLNSPAGIAMDIAGNVYVSDTGNDRVNELSLVSPQTITFASTSQGDTSTASTTTIENLGNASVVLSGLALNAGDANFAISSSSSCTSSSTVTAGDSCTVLTEFTPQITPTAGTLTGTVMLIDNQISYSLNTSTSNETATFGTSGTQSLALMGIAISATNLPQTITFTQPTTPVTYGVSPVTLVASSTSGLTVTFTVTSGPATVSGSTLTITGAGTVVVTASQAGNANYAAATSVSRTIVVTPPPSFTIAVAPGTVMVNPGSYGTATVTVTSAYGFASPILFSCTGLPTGGICSFSPGTVTPASSGTSTTQLTVYAPIAIAAVPHRFNPFLPGSALAIALCLLGCGKRRRLHAFLLLALSAIGLSLVSGCSSSPASISSPSTVTITGAATTGTTQSTTTFTLTVPYEPLSFSAVPPGAPKRGQRDPSQENIWELLRLFCCDLRQNINSGLCFDRY